jgi:glycosyltransferase involved in cell wall biosynthesis
MKILVNATTITVGGGVQAAVSFVEYVAKLDSSSTSFVFALSTAAYKTITPDVRSDPRIRVFEGSMAHPLKGRQLRLELLKLEENFEPDLIYSVGFPSYVVFKNPEAGRYTNPWEICSLPTAWSHLPFTERIVRKLKSLYRLHWAKHARYFETQTEIAKAGIVRKLRVDPERVFVLPNSVNPRFLEAGRSTKRSSPRRGAPRILCLSAAHRHKNLTLIPEVAAILEWKYRLTGTFVVTLPRDSELWRSIAREAARHRVSRLIENVGPLNLEGCVQQYRETDCLFLPTLAEIFSATYLEAMAMQVPIVTTDLDFVHTICHDAAVYYDPLSAEAGARALHIVLTDNAVREALVQKGIQRLGAFPDPETKQRLLLDWLVGLARTESAASLA